MSIVTLAEAKAQLGITTTAEDDELQPYVDGITATVEAFKREVIEQRTVEERAALVGNLRFRLWSVPVISLTSVVSLDGVTTYDVSGFDVDTDTGLVDVVTGPAPRGLVRMTYEAGYETVPVNYKRGALVILQHVWETQRGVAGGATGVLGPEELVRSALSTYTIPRKAEEWLGAPRPVVG